MSTPRWAHAPSAEHLIVFRGTLQVQSPLAIGATASNDQSVQPVSRRADGALFVPGTSVAGVLRQRLLAAAALDEPTRADRRGAALTLMGGEPGDPDGRPSRLVFDDLPTGDDATEVRDHVRLEPMAGTVDEHKKFDREAVAVGARFDLRIEWSPSQAERDDLHQREAVGTLLKLLIDGVQLGGHTRRGFGRVRLEARDGALLWVEATRLGDGRSLADLIEGRTPATKLATPADVEAFLGEAKPWPRAAPPFELSMTLLVEHSLLVRGPGRQDADASPLARPRVNAAAPKSADDLLLPGSSIAGALRQRAASIACLLSGASEEEWCSQGDDNFKLSPKAQRAVRLVEALFGTDGHRRALVEQRGEKRVELRAGAIEIDEAVLRPARTLHHTRVVIDPWTGGALEHFLFTEEAIYGGTTGVTVRIAPRDTELADATCGLAMMVLRDLWSGDLPVGGEASVGRGRLRGVEGQLVVGGQRHTLQLETPATAGLGEPVAAWVRAAVHFLEGGN